jgi:putative hydrolase of the HAD superfamily
VTRISSTDRTDGVDAVRPLVIFDLDNTLVDRTSLFREWANEVVSAYALDEAALDWLLIADDDGMAPRAELYQAMRGELGIEATSDHLASWWRSTLGRLRCDAETIAGLADLRAAGYALGIATNGGPVQDVKLDATGLRQLMDSVAISGTLGYAKPDPRILEAVARACGTTLERAWMVGDRPEADIAGALAAGARSVWIRRGAVWPDVSFKPTLEADSVPDAIRLILDHDRPATDQRRMQV